MAAAVTPQRRRRSITDLDGADASSLGGSGIDSDSTLGSKRLRRNNYDDNDDENDDASGDDVSLDGLPPPASTPALPKGKQRAGEQTPFQPGAIVRVTLTDFVTYSRAEFHPGPNLNMVIGPNGTGKSTLVCAICLGLGFSPAHLGRAKQPGEFVKNGKDKATIEIELAADPRHERNPVITTRITRADNKAVFAINGRTTTRKELDRLMRGFSIQIDNLCQFLPQDRVVEFAALSPVNLLAETQRAAAPPQMAEWHEQLKAKHRQQKETRAEQQRTLEALKAQEKRQHEQEADVARLRERAEAQERIAALDKLRPFPEYRMAKDRHLQAKTRRRHAERELRWLEEQTEPNLRAEQEKAAYLHQSKDAATRKARLVDRGETNAEQLKNEYEAKQTAIGTVMAQLEAEKKSTGERRKDMPRLQQAVRNTENALKHPPADVDFAAYNEKIRDKQRQAREIQDKQEELKREVGSLTQQMQHQQNLLERAEVQKQHSQTQAGRQASKLRQASHNAAQAWEWIQNNRHRFQGEVFGPPIVECTLKDTRHAAAVESIIRGSELVSFTVTTPDDFKMLSQTLYYQLKLSNINIRSVNQPLDRFRPPCSTEQLRAFGLEAWALDLIEGPEPVLAMLCDNRNLHATGFTSRALSTRQIDALKQDNSPIGAWVTATDMWQVVRRREYNASSTRSNAYPPARYFTDAPASQNEDEELERRINEATQAKEEFEGRSAALRHEYKDLTEQRRQLEREQQEIKEEKNRLQRDKAQFDGLEEKLRHTQEKLEDAMDYLRTSHGRRMKLEAQIDKLTLEKGQKALDYANAVDALRTLHIQHVEAQIICIEAKSDLDQLQARTVEEREMLRERHREVAQLAQETEELKQRGLELSDQCREVGALFEQDEVLNDVYAEINGWTPDQLQTEIESVQARLEMTGGAGSAHVIRDFEERAKKIEKGRGKLHEIEAKLDAVDREVANIKGQWEPQLDELVAQISQAFEENFKQINCAGEVTVHKDEDFEQWSIQIRVKFREHEQLSVLDSHRQSGGERAVSTIFYLMALQSLARAPFRVVDEINQGMDPRNERLVHSRMVDIACSPDSASQYFLITPKLLSGLKFHPSMKVHCIASGEYMPDDCKKLDFEMLARRTLALRGIAA